MGNISATAGADGIACFTKISLKRLSLFIVALCILASMHRVFAQAGTLDPTFNPTDVGFGIGDGANSFVNTSVVQPDGKIIIGGSFSTYGGLSRNFTARLNADGSLDNTFNSEGGLNASVFSIALQPNGKIIIGGDFTTFNGLARNNVARLNTDGSLDNTFSPGSGANHSIRAVVVQPDGKILIGGTFSTYNGIASNRIARLNADGSLDNTFNTGIGTNGGVQSIALQPDGKIVVGGAFTTYNGASSNRIARLNPDGTLDNTFTTGAGANSTINTTTLSPDGKIIIGGAFNSYNGTLKSRIARLNADGTVDNTFTSGSGPSGDIHSSSLQADGKIIITGVFFQYNGNSSRRIARLNTDGSFDATFNAGSGASNVVFTTTTQADGKIFIGGAFESFNNEPRNFCTRLNSDGSIDDTFNPPGTGANGLIEVTALQPDGKIIIGGIFTAFNGSIMSRIARLNIDGTLDPTFNPGSGPNSEVQTIVLQPDGKIIIGGNFNSVNGALRYYIARLNADGSLDITFNPHTQLNGSVTSAVLQQDGKIIVGGGFNTKIARLNADGSLDNTFDTGTGANNPIYSLAVQPDGKILIGGGFDSFNGTGINRIARLNTDGSLDATFNPGSGTNSSVFSIALQPDDKIIIGGFFTFFNGAPANRITRLIPNGSIDAAFNPGAGASYIVRTTVVQPDGKILVGGDFVSFNGTPLNRIARLNANGSLDATFNNGTGPNNTVFKTMLQSDGKIIAVGSFISYNNIGRNRIARLLNDVKQNQSIEFDSLAVKTYGDSTFTLNATATSNLPISYASSDESVAVIANNTVTIVGAGETIITASQAGNESYLQATDVQQTLSVSPASLIVKADDKTLEYGKDYSTHPPFTTTFSGFVGNDDVSVLDSLPGWTLKVPKALADAGTDLEIRWNRKGFDNNYDYNIEHGKLTITKAPLTITAENKSKVQGEANPPLTLSFSPFVGTQTFLDLDTLPVATTVAVNSSPPGTYPIQLNGGSDNNYEITLVDGLLTILPAPQIAFYLDDQLVTRPDSISFGEVFLGQSVEKQLKIKNAGSAPLSLHLNVLHSEIFDFTSFASSDLEDTLAVGDSLLFTIKFTPANHIHEAVNFGHFDMSTNDPDRSYIVIGLYGDGLPPAPIIAMADPMEGFEGDKFNLLGLYLQDDSLKFFLGEKQITDAKPVKKAKKALKKKKSSSSWVNEDDDDDGILNGVDNCPWVVNVDQLNNDSDPNGNQCDCMPADSSYWCDEQDFNYEYVLAVPNGALSGPVRVTTSGGEDVSDFIFTVLHRPTQNATLGSIVFGTQNDATITMIPGDGQHRLMVYRKGSAPDWVPTDGALPQGPAEEAEPAEPRPGDVAQPPQAAPAPEAAGPKGEAVPATPASNVGNGQIVAYGDSLNNFHLTNLQLDSTYYFKVFEYSGTSPKYLTDSVPAYNFIKELPILTPDLPSSYISFSNVLATSLSVNFSPGNGEQRLAILKAGTTPTFIPSNDHLYSGDLGNGELAVYNGTDSTFALNGLLPDTDYFITIFEFNTDSTNTRYLLTSAPTASARTAKLPNVYVTAPADGAIGQKVKLNLTSRSVAGASTYTIDISPSPDFTGNVRTRSGNRIQTFDTLQYNTTYHARVKTNLNPSFGKVTTFSTVGPESYSYVTSPASNAVGVKLIVNVSSNIVPQASTYTIELNTDPNFASASALVLSGGRTLSFGPLLPNTIYHSRVKTNLSDVWGQTRSFTTMSAPVISFVTSPANNAVNVNTTINISSNSVPGAALYTIQLSETANFSDIAFAQSSSSRTIAFSGLKYDMLYYNRVLTNLAPEPGEVRSFRTRTASSISYVTSPANGATGLNITLNVSSNVVPGATEYTIQLSEFEDFSSIAFENTATTRTVPFTGLKYNTTYYNRVKTNLSSEFGEPRSFTTKDAASLAYLTSPADGATNVTWIVNLTSHSVPGASQYTIEASTSPDFSGGSIIKISSSPTSAFQLGYDQLYYVRVKTNLSPNTGPVRTFTTGNPVSLAFVISPKDEGVDAPTTLNVSANALTGATLYTIELNTAENFQGQSIVKSKTTRTISFSGLAEGTTYYSRVSTSLAPGQWGPTRSFTTVGSLASARSSGWEGDSTDDVVFGEVKVEVYPNPFRERLTIYVETPAQQPLEITLVDVTGKEVHRSKSFTNSLVEVNEPLQNGVYMLNLRTGLNSKIIRVIKADQ